MFPYSFHPTELPAPPPPWAIAASLLLLALFVVGLLPAGPTSPRGELPVAAAVASSGHR